MVRLKRKDHGAVGGFCFLVFDDVVLKHFCIPEVVMKCIVFLNEAYLSQRAFPSNLL